MRPSIAATSALLSLLITASPAAAEKAGTVDEPAGEAVTVDDPLESMNRAIFRFNLELDEYVLRPVATGWDVITPRPVQTAVENFYDNLLFPIRFVNLLAQGEMDPAAITLSRFCVNTTLGIGGIFDAASWVDLERHEADFGQTLAKWGVPSGPYLVLPLWGFSNPRDTTGLFVDAYLGVTTFFIDWPILLGSVVAETINRRSLLLDDVENLKEASLDLYVAARDAYSQQRSERILGAEQARAARDEDLYYYEDFDEEEW